jgi:tRNA threonylcarbamoyladenosine biosynthesis protein TsaE
MELRVRSEGETRELGRALGRAARAGDVVALRGPLGAGKTVLAQGILEGLGCPGPHPSPTFTLVRAYEGRLPAYHVDLYRLGPGAAAEDLGWEEILGGDGVAVVEWADYLEGVGDVLPAERLDVRLRRTGGAGAEGERVVELDGRGAAGQRLAAAARGALPPC